jgi:hypothetical protein
VGNDYISLFNSNTSFGSEPFVVKSGNVGIGTTDPQTKLHLGSGTLRIDNNGADASGAIYLSADESTIQGPFANTEIRMGSNLTLRGHNVSTFQFGTYGAFVEDTTEVMRIDGGNVGIGTTSPGYKLDVASGGSTTARIGATSTDTMVVGGGAGKITAGTFDPVFNIEGIAYATYSPDNVGGVRAQTTGKVVLKSSVAKGATSFSKGGIATKNPAFGEVLARSRNNPRGPELTPTTTIVKENILSSQDMHTPGSRGPAGSCTPETPVSTRGSDCPRPTADSLYEYVIDFSIAEVGSDLWLFKKVSNFGAKTAWERLSVLLTPEGEAKTWYTLNPAEDSLAIYADRPVAVSYQLSAPRVDYKKWGNLNHDGVEGIRVEEFAE